MDTAHPKSLRIARERATTFLTHHLLLDAHNDLPWVIRNEVGVELEKFELELSRPGRDTDIPRMRQGHIGAQVFAAFVPTDTPNVGDATQAQIDLIRRMEQQYDETFLPVRRSSDIADARRVNKIGTIISVEGCAGLEGLATLHHWYSLGVRVITLCHNRSLDWVESATGTLLSGGLSTFGRSVIAEANRLGIVVDLSHASVRAAGKVLDVTRAPVAFTHSNAAALCNHVRNVPDTLLARVRINGGIVMATFVPHYLGHLTSLGNVHFAPNGPVQVANHIEHIANVAGIDHVGIGSDYFGGENPPGLEDVSQMPAIFAELIMRGWSDQSLAKLASENFLRVMRAVEREAENSE